VLCVDMAPGDGLLRIGELSRRVGVSDHVLRAWERRYGLLKPVRSDGGFRLYSEADESRVRRMQTHLARGLSAAEAARAALGADEIGAGSAAGGSGSVAVGRHEGLADSASALALALDELDEPAAQAVLDRLLSDFTVETVLRDVLMPYLQELGERWVRGSVTIAQEHFGSNLLRGRLASLARGWGQGHGPRAVLACPPGELHDLGLLVFGIALNRNGWRIDYLGADTPLDDLINAAADTSADLVVLAAATPERFNGLAADLSRLASVVPLALAGAGAGRTTAQPVGARLLTADPVTEAQRLLPPSTKSSHDAHARQQHDPTQQAPEGR
jgi:MerR family transcriptional regulator, light-induced transcriptional regulator